MYAYKLQKKAAQVGFDWDDIADVYKKVEEEYRKLQEAGRTFEQTDLQEMDKWWEEAKHETR